MNDDKIYVSGRSAPAVASLEIRRRHSAAVRWMHWLNFPLLMLMIWSGLLIYWSDSASGYTFEHRVYRVGVGSFTLIRLFPDWFYSLFRMNGHMTRGLAFHAFFMWLFTVNGVAYVLFLAVSGQWRNIVPDRRAVTETFARMRARLAPGGTAAKYTLEQRVAYTLVLLMGAGSVVTGIAIWKPASLPMLTALLGGYAFARWLHFWLTMGFCGFLCVHVVQAVRAGWGVLSGMVSGIEVVRRKAPVVEIVMRDPVVVTQAQAEESAHGA